VQTLCCLELWVKVLSAAGAGGALQPLVYPLVQLLLAAARLVPTPRYFPIRLRLVRALNRLGQVCRRRRRGRGGSLRRAGQVAALA
jgi:nucleolar complex protein 2